MTVKPEVSVLMPTYNDSKYVANAIRSVMNQDYRNWELIIVDDGSADDTSEIIKSFSDERLTYLRQENSGQLNALINGANSVRGEYVTILHSDDEFSDSQAFERNVAMLKSCDCDGLFSDHVKMDEGGQIHGRAKTVSVINLFSPALLFLRGGSNLTTDAFFVKRTAFENVVSVYMYWNVPYWLVLKESRAEVLKLRKIGPWYKYRVYSGNYARTDVGKFEAVNGCLRAVVEVGQRLHVPFRWVQRMLAKLTGARLRPIFEKKPSSSGNLQEVIQYVLRRYSQAPDNPYFKGLLGFYANYPSDRTIDFHIEEDEKLLYGKDARLFFNLMKENKIPASYEHLLAEAADGFGIVSVKDRATFEKARSVLRFLNLTAKVEMP